MASAIQSLVPNLKDIEAYRAFLDIVLSNICGQGGAVYGGILRSQYSSMPALVIFSSLKNQNTLTLPLLDVSPMTVAAKVRESDLLFAGESPAPAPAAIRPSVKLACLVHQQLSRDSQTDWNELVANLRRIRKGVSTTAERPGKPRRAKKLFARRRAA
jgi:hypothetical protein